MVAPDQVIISASAHYLYSFCQEAYRLQYIEHVPKDKQDETKLVLSKAAHFIGSEYAMKKHRDSWSAFVNAAINDHLKEFDSEKFAWAKDVVLDLVKKYVALLGLINPHGEKITVEETYGSTFKTGVTITDLWAFTGGADLVIWSKSGSDEIWDFKWTWTPEETDPQQLKIYAAVHEHLTGRAVTKVGYAAMGPQKLVFYKFDSVIRKDTLRTMDAMATQIKLRQFLASPAVGKCSYCRLRSACGYRITKEYLGENANGTNQSSSYKQTRNPVTQSL